MATTFLAGIMGVGTAKADVSFASKGFSASNIAIIYEVGAVRKSHDPARTINSINGFTAGKDYCLITKVDMDLSDVFGSASNSLPADASYDVQASGAITNRIVAGNTTSYLTPFANNNIRIIRNNVPQTAGVDFTWNAATALVTWTVAPQLLETFLVQAY